MVRGWAYRQARMSQLHDLGWETCKAAQQWDATHSNEVEPDRWAEFWCPYHNHHKVITDRVGKRVYAGILPA